MRLIRTGSRVLLFVLLFGLMTLPLCASAASAVDLHPNSELVIEQADFTRLSAAVADQFMTPVQGHDLPFQPLRQADWNQGITGDAYWVRFSVHNPTEEDISWVLQYETAYLDTFSVFWRAASTGLPTDKPDFHHLSINGADGFSARPMDYRKPALRLSTEAGQGTELWVRLQQNIPDAVSLRMLASEENLFNQISLRHTLLQGGYFGALLALIVLTMTLSTLLRRRLFLAYGVYLVFTTLMWLKLSGLGFQYIWPDNPVWHKQGYHIIFLLTAMSAWYYTQIFFSLHQNAPVLNRLISGLLVVFGLGLLGRLAGIYEPILILSFLSLASLLFLPMVGCLMWYRGNRYARWFTVGWSVYSMGLLVSVLSAASHWLPWGMNPLAYTQATSLVEVLFLSLALADKLVNLERERTVAVNLSRLDPLTGLGNRRELTKAYQDLQGTNWSACKERVALLMIDLDHFKVVNDAYGHDAGDVVLKRLADELRRICRSSDTLVRFGGEEFAILLRLSDMASAVSIAERIRLGFSNRPTLYEGRLIKHTLSIGITEITAGGELISTRRMMREADDALYYAKSVGRNSTVVKRGNDYVMCSQPEAGSSSEEGAVPDARTIS